MHHWKQPQSEHKPCPTTARHVSKSPLMTSRVHCEVTDKCGMQQRCESHPPTTTYWMFLSHTHHHLSPGCPIGRRQVAPQQRKEREDSRNVSVSSTFWSTEGAMEPQDLTQLAQPALGGKCSRTDSRTGRKWAYITFSGAGGSGKKLLVQIRPFWWLSQGMEQPSLSPAKDREKQPWMESMSRTLR